MRFFQANSSATRTHPLSTPLTQHTLKALKKKKFDISTGTSFTASIISMFLLMVGVFIFVEHAREKEFKIELLKDKLKDYNDGLQESLQRTHDTTFVGLDKYIKHHALSNLRVTIVNTHGDVVYDNLYKNYKAMNNHLLRSEIIQALKTGHGYDVDRKSNTLNQEYFYVATYYPKQDYIIRSALPYDQHLLQTLTADMRFIWLTLAIALMLSILLYRFIHRLTTNIKKLRAFASRITNKEALSEGDVPSFSNDELGEIANRITSLYIQLKHTEEQQRILKRQLTENATHELKTPVATIQGFIETILADPNMDESVRTQFLQRCFKQSQRLTSILNDMSTLHRLDDAPDAYQFGLVDMTALLKQVFNETEQALHEHKMSIINQMPQRLVISGNFSLLYSIFRNLTDNAISYAGSDTTITYAAWHETPYWHFTVTDNGIGIPKEHQPRIFERFYRVDKGRSRKSGGTGLGLAIVKNAVLAHGGNIEVYTPEAGGTCFHFTLRDDISQ